MLGGWLRKIWQNSDMEKTGRKSHFDPAMQEAKEDTIRESARQIPVPVQHVQQETSLVGRTGVSAVRPNGRRAKERKRQPRVRNHLDDREAENLVAAIRFAERVGHPITHFITIIPNRLGEEAKTGGFQELVMEDAVIEFIRRMTGLMDRRDIPRVYAWVRENTIQGGEHLHIGIHIPPENEDSMIDGIAKLLRAPRGCDRDLKPSKGEVARSRKRGWLVQRVLFGLKGALGLADYISKGTEKGAQGWTKGKRCGVARMLDLSAREKRGIP